ncbi:MAG: putative PEP-binding protein, partial [Candidatus Aenigmatarchaeota archaeon]
IKEHPLKMIKEGREKEFIEKLSKGIAKIACAFYPREVIVRFSDFKTNEYRNLKGGEDFEDIEENPMIGWRGASRYISPEFEKAFRAEIKAIKKAIEDFELNNIKVMVPFCRTIEEAKKVLNIIKHENLKTEIYVMAEIPSNIILAEKFAKLFDGFSIGSNDLTQLTLGIDRDNEKLANEFDERNEAVKILIRELIKKAHKYRRKVGICGDAPSTYEDFLKFLVDAGIDSVSVTPDVALETKLRVARLEKIRNKRKS